MGSVRYDQESFNQYKEIVVPLRNFQKSFMLLDLVTFPLVVSLTLTLLWRSLNFLCPIQQLIHVLDSKVESSFEVRKLTAVQLHHSYRYAHYSGLRENHAWHCFTTVLFMISSLLFGSCILLDRLWSVLQVQGLCEPSDKAGLDNEQNFNFQPHTVLTS